LKNADARTKLILEGPIARGVLLIAIPSVAMMLVNTLNGFLDRFFVSKLGPDALAAVTVCTSFLWLILAAAMAISTGTSALVGRFIGAREPGNATEAARQSLLSSFLLSVAVAVPLALFREPILRWQGASPETMPMASQYLLVLALAQLVMFPNFIIGGIFRGLGDTVRPFLLTIASVIVHALGNFFLIPRIGLVGGALAMVLSQIVTLALSLPFLKQSPVAAMLTGPWRLDLSWVRRILKIGLLAALQQILRMGSMIAVQHLLLKTPDANAAVAALGIGLLSESIAFMPGFGYSIAASAFVGQNLGARQPERARRGAWAATWQAIFVMSLMGVVFYVFAESFAHLFLQQRESATPAENLKVAETLHLTVQYLKIAAISEPFLALSMGLVGALQGAGDTKSPTLLTAISMLLIRLPLVWFLVGPFGVSGAWWAMTISTIVQGIFVVIVFRKGNWQRTKV
jgi:multidrug resistance protein, MATE family